MLYVASSNPPSVDFVICIFSIQKSCQWFVVVVYYYISSLKVVILFHDCVIYTVGFLFRGAPFPLGISEGV